jgi:arginine/lysine/ornithine decarboxylase
VSGFDPLRVVLNVQGLGLTGFDAAAWLEEQHGVVPELATNRLVVLVFGPGSTAADADALVKACQLLCEAHASQDVPQPPATPTQTPADSSSAATDGAQTLRDPSSVESAGAVLTPRQAFYADAEAVSLNAAAGRVSAELLCPYPPGVPVVFPGEVFTPASIQVLRDTLSSGGVVTGGHDSSLATVLVVAEGAV